MALFSSLLHSDVKAALLSLISSKFTPAKHLCAEQTLLKSGQDRDLHHRNTYNLKVNIRPSSSPESLGHPKTEDFSPSFALGAEDSVPWGIPTPASSYTLLIMDRQ